MPIDKSNWNFVNDQTQERKTWNQLYAEQFQIEENERKKKIDEGQKFDANH